MSVTTSVVNSFKEEALKGIHDLESDTLKIAFIKENPDSDFDETTTNYSELGTDEVVGTGYTAGGPTLTGGAVSLDGNSAVVTFNNAVVESATISAIGGIIYNTSQSNRAVCVLDFDGVKTSTNGDFTVIFPIADANLSVIVLT